MHSENKEHDDSVMPTSSTLLQITAKGEYLVNLQCFHFWVLGFLLLLVFVSLKIFFNLCRIKQEMAALSLLHRGEKTEYGLVQMHIHRKGELRHLASNL